MPEENLKQNNQPEPQPTPTPPAPEPPSTPPPPAPTQPPKPEPTPETVPAENKPKITPLPAAEPVVEPQKPIEEKIPEPEIPTEPEPAPKEESQYQADSEPKEIEKATSQNVAPISTPPVPPIPRATEESAPEEGPVKVPTPTSRPAPRPAPATPTPPTPAPSAPEIPFAVKFKNKLKDLLQIANQKRSQKIQDNLEKIMAYAREKQKITNDEVERITNVGDKQATRYLKILVKQSHLMKFGTYKNTFYKPIKK